jgi:hypothetical protein
LGSGRNCHEQSNDVASPHHTTPHHTLPVAPQVVFFDRSPERRAPFYNLLRSLGMARMVNK